MKSSRQIALLTPGFPVDEKDFLCIPPLQDYLLAMKELPDAPTVRVIAFQYPYHPVEYHWHGIEVHGMGGNNKGFPKKFLTWRNAAQTFRLMHEAQRFDLIHSLWLNECAWVGQRLSRELNVPHFCTAMGQDVRHENKYLRRLNRGAITTIAISQRASDALQQSTGRPADHMIPWGLGAETLNRDLNQARTIDVLGVGSLSEVKNYSLFVKIISEMVKRNPALRVTLIGTGSEDAKLKTQVSQLGLEKNIRFAGLLTRPEVLNCMQQSKVFLHTAKSEGQGLVFLEALAAGMKIVSTPVGMAQEGENWRISNSEEDFVRNCESFLRNYSPAQPEGILTAKETAKSYLKLFSESQ
jgi:1,2-diacylglycerol 3-alpha-glucosyltransferase